MPFVLVLSLIQNILLGTEEETKKKGEEQQGGEGSKGEEKRGGREGGEREKCEGKEASCRNGKMKIIEDIKSLNGKAYNKKMWIAKETVFQNDGTRKCGITKFRGLN